MSDRNLPDEKRLTFEKLTFEIDFQDELEIAIEIYDGEFSRWLNKDQGRELQKLLNKWLGT